MDDADQDELAATALIVGCGYLGTRLAQRLVDRGVTVLGTTRTPARAQRLVEMGVQPLFLSVTELLTTASLKPAQTCEELDVYYMVPPGRSGGVPSPEDVLLDGLANVVGALRPETVRRAVMVSSTAVYGHAERVDADTPAQPTGERARWLAQSEELWLRSDLPAHVLRLAGMYGPERIIGLQALREGSPLVGDPRAPLNLIHVDDAVSLLLAMMAQDRPARVELGCDDEPAPRLDYYRYLASKVGLPEPTVLDDATAARTLGLNLDRLRRSPAKRCDNALTRARTRWQPQYPSYREGLDALLSAVM